MADKYDPKEHKIEAEYTYRTAGGNITVQRVETTQMPTCTWIYYRVLRKGKEIAWGDRSAVVMKDALVSLLGMKDKERIRLFR